MLGDPGLAGAFMANRPSPMVWLKKHATEPDHAAQRPPITVSVEGAGGHGKRNSDSIPFAVWTKSMQFGQTLVERDREFRRCRLQVFVG